MTFKNLRSLPSKSAHKSYYFNEGGVECQYYPIQSNGHPCFFKEVAFSMQGGGYHHYHQLVIRVGYESEIYA